MLNKIETNTHINIYYTCMNIYTYNDYYGDETVDKESTKKD